MILRVRLPQALANSLSLLDHGLLALSLSVDPPEVPPPVADASEYRVEIVGPDATLFQTLKDHWHLTNAALVRAALVVAGTSHFTPAKLLPRSDVLAILRDHGHLKRTPAARAHKVAAEAFDAAGASRGFVTRNTITSLRHRPLPLAS
jgi:hypothetical protein